MLADLINITCSYLNLEEVLTLFKNNQKLRDRIIRKNFELLTHAVFETEKGNIETVKYLIKYNYATDYKAVFNVACSKGYLEILKLIFTKVDLQPFIKTVETSLNYAIEGGNLEIVKFLLQYGITVYSFDSFRLAKQKGYTDVVNYCQISSKNEKLKKEL
jgi:ankyrin repeat protein